VFPDSASLFVTGVEDPAGYAETQGFWRNVYGFDMSAMLEERDRFVESTVDVAVVDVKKLVTDTARLLHLDMASAKTADLDFEAPFALRASREGLLQGLLVHFDVGFQSGCSHPVTLSTAAWLPPTHWKQTVLHLAKPLRLAAGASVRGTLRATRRAANPRDYDIVVTLRAEGDETEVYVQDFAIKA
jgi:protein arginine N-methyltransferase 1